MKEQKQKNNVPQWVFNILFALLTAAYGFIFSIVFNNIAENKAKIEALNPTLLKIQTDIAEIKTNITWILQNNNKRGE